MLVGRQRVVLWALELGMKSSDSVSAACLLCFQLVCLDSLSSSVTWR